MDGFDLQGIKTNYNNYYPNIFTTYTVSIHGSRFLGAGNCLLLLLLSTSFVPKTNVTQQQVVRIQGSGKRKTLLVMAARTMITVIIQYHPLHLIPNPSLLPITLSQMSKEGGWSPEGKT